eukprot:TRINITY_DN11734_c0_g1_i1.p1 TRINITY_DN11734_c0_g1~~TRINITY_DN11734_c0_g1_i1.p1  ORF type:complete len:436 (+),score=78.75 TRINITY_DN11734_c0_g1_i1:55-1362(+)
MANPKKMLDALGPRIYSLEYFQDRILEMFEEMDLTIAAEFDYVRGTISETTEKTVSLVKDRIVTKSKGLSIYESQLLSVSNLIKNQRNQSASVQGLCIPQGSSVRKHRFLKNLQAIVSVSEKKGFVIPALSLEKSFWKTFIEDPQINLQKGLKSDYPSITFSLDSMTGEKASVGGNGSENTQFRYPYAVTVHHETGRVFVVDNDNNCVKVFTADLQYITSFGSGGRDDGEFRQPCDISISNDGRIAVTDWDRHDVQFFDMDFNFIHCISGKGNGPGQFDDPRNSDFDSEGNFYIVDANNSRIQKFDRDYKFVLEITSSAVPGLSGWKPYGLTISYEDEILVACRTCEYVYAFDRDGIHLRSISIPKTDGNWNYLTRGPQGGFACSDYDKCHVTFHDRDGVVLRKLPVTNPVGICFGPNQTFYACNWSQHRVVLYH